MKQTAKMGCWICLVMFALGFVFPAAVGADGDSRRATDTERSYYRRVATALSQALPEGPPGWEKTLETEISEPEYVVQGNERQPMPVEFEITWEDARRRDQASAGMVEAGAKVLETQKAQQPTHDLEVELERLATDLGKAVEKNDTAEVQRLQAELDALGQKLQVKYSAQDQAINAAMQAREARDIKASIRFSVNRFDESFDGPVHPEPPVAGATAFRMDGYRHPGYGWQEETTYIFMGRGWRLDQSISAMIVQPAPGLPHARVQTLVVRIQAHPERTRQLIQGMDWKSLQSLVFD